MPEGKENESGKVTETVIERDRLGVAEVTGKKSYGFIKTKNIHSFLADYSEISVPGREEVDASGGRSQPGRSEWLRMCGKGLHDLYECSQVVYITRGTCCDVCRSITGNM